MMQGFSKAAFTTVGVALIATIGAAISFPGKPGIAVTVMILVILIGPRLLDREQTRSAADPTPADPTKADPADPTRDNPPERRAGGARRL